MMKSFLIYFVIFVCAYASKFAQAQNCSTEFSKITRSCAQSKLEKFDELYVDLKKLRGGVYLYENTSNVLGKVYFYSVLNNTPKVLKNKKFKNTLECVVYFRYQSLNGRNSRFNQGNISIGFDHGEWGKHGLDFEGDGLDDLVLKNDQGSCIVESANKAKFVLHKRNKVTFEGQGSMMLYYGAFFLIAVAVFLVAFHIFQDNSRYQASETLEDGPEVDKVKEKSRGVILKYSRPFFKRYFSPVVAGMKNRRQIKEKYKYKLASAGLTKELPPEDFFAYKLFLILGFPIVFLGVRTFAEADWSLTLVPVLAGFGFIYPDIWLGGEVKRRQEELVLNMPFVVDMLALSIEAGLDFIAAIAKVLEKAPPSALVEEFEIMLKEIQIGSSRAEALRSFSNRNNSISISSFCATLISADSVGASIGPILKVLGAEMRQKRSASIEKKAASAATKMLLPMMIFILPAIIIIIMAPMVMQFFNG